MFANIKSVTCNTHFMLLAIIIASYSLKNWNVSKINETQSQYMNGQYDIL